MTIFGWRTKDASVFDQEDRSVLILQPAYTGAKVATLLLR